MSTVKNKEALKHAAKNLQYAGDVKVLEVFNDEIKQATKDLAREQAENMMLGMAKMGNRAVSRVSELIESTDENIATKNSHFVINHQLGMPTQKSVVQRTSINIDVVAD